MHLHRIAAKHNSAETVSKIMQTFQNDCVSIQPGKEVIILALRRIATLAAIVFVLLRPVASTADDAKSSLSVSEARDLLAQNIHDDAVYASWTKIRCLSFDVEDVTDSFIDFGIHEIHGGGCPGDPLTSPIVDRFRVMRASHAILWFDLPDDEYIDYKIFKARRKK